MRPVTDYDKGEARKVNARGTVGILPVRNAAGQKPVAIVRADYLQRAAMVADVEYGNIATDAVLYVWVLNSRLGYCNWLALSDRRQGQYPDEAVVIAGRIDKRNEIVP